MSDDSFLTQWMRLAEMDMETARHMLGTYYPIPVEIICFHSQQAAEKMLKYYLLSKGVEAPRTHDLQLLLELCIEFEVGFNEIYNEASLLTRYGVIPRYPTEIELIATDAQAAIEHAEKVVNYIKAII